MIRNSKVPTVKEFAKIIQHRSLRPKLSLLVLIGFLFIQFHSFLHVDFHALGHDLTEHSVSLGVHITTAGSDHNAVVDCPECVLTKSLHLEVHHPVEFAQNSTFSLLNVDLEQRAFEFAQHHFQLRAPPFLAV